MPMVPKVLVIAVLAAVVFSPMLFSLTHSLLGNLVADVAKAGGSNPTLIGMALHTLVLAGLLMYLKNMGLLGRDDMVCAKCAKKMHDAAHRVARHKHL